MTDEQMFAKDWLNRNYGDHMEIEALRNRLELLKNDIDRCTSVYGRADYQAYPDTKANREELLAKAADMNNFFEKRIMQLKKEDEITLQVIQRLESGIYRTILISRYINRLPWNKIQKNIKFERSNTYKLHSEALAKIYPYIREEIVGNDIS